MRKKKGSVLQIEERKMNNVSLEMRISEVEKKLCMIIPKVYRDFLLENNNMHFNNGILYDIDAIEERYIMLEFSKYAPNYIPIGNDNGDYELVMKSGISVTKFGFLEQGSIGILEPEHIQSFIQWYKSGHDFSFDVEDDIDWSKNVQVILTKCPRNKARTMMTIRNTLMLDTPISELLSVVDKTPYILTDNLSAATAKSIIEKFHLDEWLRIKF